MNNYKLLEMSSFTRNIKSECTLVKFHKNLLIAGSHNGLLICWDIHTGIEKWSSKYDGPCSGAIIEDGEIYLVEEGKIHCIDLQSGESKWSNEVEGLSEFVKIYNGHIWVGASVYDLHISNYSESGIWMFNKNGVCIKKYESESKPWSFDVLDNGLYLGLSRPLCGYARLIEGEEIEYYKLDNKSPITTGISDENTVFLGHSDGNVSIIGNGIKEWKNKGASPIKDLQYNKGISMGSETGKIYSENDWEIDLKIELDIISSAPSNNNIDYLWASAWNGKTNIFSIDNNSGNIEFKIEHPSRVRKIICFDQFIALGDSNGKIFLIENDVLQRRLKSKPEDIRIDEKRTLLRERLSALRE